VSSIRKLSSHQLIPLLFSPAIPNDALLLSSLQSNRNQLICKYIFNSTVSNMRVPEQYQIVFMDCNSNPTVLQKLQFSVSQIYLMRMDYICLRNVVALGPDYKKCFFKSLVRQHYIIFSTTMLNLQMSLFH
jgi:hypothetical protein